MINPHLPAVPQAPPAIPHHPRRRQQNGLPYTPIVPDNTSIHHPPFQNYTPHHSQAHHRPSQNYQPTQHYTGPYLPQAIQQHQLQHYPHHQPLVVSSYPSSQHSGHVSHHSQPTLPSLANSHANASSTAPAIQLNLREAAPLRREPFYPPVPWLSVPEEPFPPRALRRRRKRRAPQSSAAPLELPSSQPRSPTLEPGLMQQSEIADLTTQSESETPSTSQPPSEVDSTHPTTPSSALPSSSPATQSTTNLGSTPTRTILTVIPLTPAVPHLPALPKQAPREPAPAATATPSKGSELPPESAISPVSHLGSSPVEPRTSSPVLNQTPKPAVPPLKTTHKSWADLVRTTTTKAATAGTSGMSNDPIKTNGFDIPKATSLVDVLSSFSVDGDNEETKVSFLEPRGLVNTGNMCYMNSVLQILVFCVPLYRFLDRVGKRAAHSFKNDTHLIDAMIMFMREFPVIDSAVSIEQLKMRLKDNELEQFGEAFIPEYVYNAIRHLPRFSSLQRGHQQDAEEFLGFLLGGLHDECVQVMRNSSASNSSTTKSAPANDLVSTHRHPFEAPRIAVEDTNGGGWLEVGPKQKAVVTRSSGTITTESPITKIFGGKLRSELRVPGLKNSVTLEPYQPLQLDIQSPQVNNITEALKNLTRSETLHGDFNSPRGPGTTATKQVFIESLPPVLILHLKRFQYNNAGGTQKIWKKVGYPLELEIPREAFPPHKRGLAAQGWLPKYQLIGVVYHHGKNASGGHYTVDVRRQDGSEWIRLDDTVIRRVRSEDVAEGGSEETPKILAASLESHKKDGTFEQVGIEDGEEAGDDEGWKQVNGSSSAGTGEGKRSWSGAVNGNSTTTNGAAKGKPNEKFSVKDNKVAYLLFYQKIKA